MAKEEKTVYEYNRDGSVASETTTIRKVPDVAEPPPGYVLTVRVTDSPEWFAEHVERTLRTRLLGSRYAGAEIKVTRE